MDTGQDQRWVAALETPVQVGDVVQTDEGMAMTGFTSKTLGRTFNVAEPYWQLATAGAGCR
jgi:hypothetical protein